MSRKLIPYAGKDGIGGAHSVGPLLKEMIASYKAAGIDVMRRVDGHKDCLERIDTAEIARRLAEIPFDTRDLTARLMGDPIPGDARRAA